MDKLSENLLHEVGGNSKLVYDYWDTALIDAMWVT